MLKQTIESKTLINTQGDKVWQALQTLADYQRWNSATQFKRNPRVGKVQLMSVKLGLFPLLVPVLIQYCDEKQGLRWIGGIPGLITGSHYFHYEAVSENETQLIQGEDFNGVLVPILLALLKQPLATLYDTVNQDLKHYCEQHAPAPS